MGVEIDDWKRWTTEVPLFRDFTEDQLRRFLSAGEVRDYASGQKLIEKGQPSEELFVLLSGEVYVEVAGVPLAQILPVSPVGEMGVVTETSRSVTVRVEKLSSVLVIAKENWDQLLMENGALGRKLYRNLVVVLSARIQDMNDRAERELETLDGRLREANRRLELAYLQMRDQKDRVSMLLYRGDVGFLVDRDGRIDGITESGLARTGQSRDDLIDTSFLDLVDADSAAELRKAMKEAWVGTAHQISVRMVGMRGKPGTFTIRVTRVNMDRRKMLLISMRESEAEEDREEG